MDIAIIGTGYVGLVTGACLAELGHKVICADKDKRKIQLLRRLSCPIHEPGLRELIVKNVKEKRLSFTDNTPSAIRNSFAVFNCVGTPLNENGLPNLTETYNVARIFAQNLNNRKIFINKSTVPVGTGATCEKIILSISKKNFHIVSNPEFLRQGTAVKDFMQPERIIVGTDDAEASPLMEKLYSPLIRAGKHYIVTDIKTAELIKYAANAFIATRISFINEMAAYCGKNGINIENVAKAIGLDPRIGLSYLRAGIGYGGGCLSKDIKSLISLGKKARTPFHILEQVSAANTRQRTLFAKKITSVLERTYGDRPCKTAVWGLAYKPHTDDLRDSPSIDIIKYLQRAGHTLHLYDPAANENAKKLFPPSSRLKYFNDKISAAKGCDALVILTEWPEFSKTGIKKLNSFMRGRHVFDGRNIFNPDRMKSAGFIYTGIAATAKNLEN